MVLGVLVRWRNVGRPEFMPARFPAAKKADGNPPRVYSSVVLAPFGSMVRKEMLMERPLQRRKPPPKPCSGSHQSAFAFGELTQDTPCAEPPKRNSPTNHKPQ